MGCQGGTVTEVKVLKRREYQRAWYEKNKKDISTKHKAKYFGARRERILESHRKYYHANRVAQTEANKRRNYERRKRVIDFYGGKCRCCGESNYMFLAIDHVNNDGAQERRGRFHGGTSIIYKIIREGFPAKYQVLCHNCNSAKGYYGHCPHGNC